jgi:hypothetical protein
MSDQVHVISTLKVVFTKVVYVLCKKLLKIFRLANFSGEAILHKNYIVPRLYYSIKKRCLKGGCFTTGVF